MITTRTRPATFCLASGVMVPAKDRPVPRPQECWLPGADEADSQLARTRKFGLKITATEATATQERPNTAAYSKAS